jgi:hypothetical protein
MIVRKLDPEWRRLRDLLLFRTPRLWSLWPVLPVIRLGAGGADGQCGFLYDARGVWGTYGFSATVFLGNVFLLPPDEAGVLALPRCVYDTAEEICDAGWTAD